MEGKNMARHKVRWLSVLAALMLMAPALPSASHSYAQGACRTFVETGKTVCDVFLTYWNTHGGLAQQGYPISDPRSETSDTDGKAYTTQYFERAVFEQHPEFAGSPNEVLLSQLGTFRWRDKQTPPTPAATPTSAVPPTATPPPAPNTPPPVPTNTPPPAGPCDGIPPSPNVIILPSNCE